MTDAFEPALAAGPVLPPLEPPPPPPPPLGPPPAPGPPLDPAPATRRLIGVSFDLLSRSTDEMRPASFYIGAIVLGTMGASVLAGSAFQAASLHLSLDQTTDAIDGAFGVWVNFLGLIAALGLIVATIEGRAMAAAILGGHLIRRPVTVRQALARSRSAFWRVLLAALIVAIPVGLTQGGLALSLGTAFPQATELATAVTILAGAVVGGPFAYLLSGVVLGDVGPVESMRRSFRVFGVRKAAAFVVALFESIAQLLILFGVSAGLDIAIRVLDALGLSADPGVAGIALTGLMIVAGVFALGTLLFTVSAISIAPQVVMFVGLTHATMGLDHVRPGADRDPDARQPGRRRFRRFTRPMLAGFAISICGLLGALSALPS